MKDGEVEEDQGGYGLVLGPFYANALAPFPLFTAPLAGFPSKLTCNNIGPFSTVQVSRNMLHGDIIRTRRAHL